MWGGRTPCGVGAPRVWGCPRGVPPVWSGCPPVWGGCLPVCGVGAPRVWWCAPRVWGCPPCVVGACPPCVWWVPPVCGVGASRVCGVGVPPRVCGVGVPPVCVVGAPRVGWGPPVCVGWGPPVCVGWGPPVCVGWGCPPPRCVRWVPPPRCVRWVPTTVGGCSPLKRGKVPRARQALVGAALSPKTEETLEELRRRRPQAALRQIPQEVMVYAPDSPLAIDMKIFAKCFRTAPAGSSAGPGGCSNEMLKVCLDDEETCQLLFQAAEDFARGTAPNVSQCFMLANLTALQKKDGSVRGIATGTTFRRLVAKTLARQFNRQVDAACAPFQFALSTRAGVDCVGHVVRATTDADCEAGVPSWQSCLRCRDSADSCHSYVPSTLARRGTFGKTRSGNDTKSINMREANRETL